jgi:hypothetical protein
MMVLVVLMRKEEAAALWNEACAEESARLDHEPEHEARSNAHVAPTPWRLSVFVTGRFRRLSP